jgi:hypothetical protein
MNTIKDIVPVVAILATTAFLFYVADYGGLIQFFLAGFLVIWVLILLFGGSYFIWQYRRR